jgi:DNA repair protein RadC
MKIKDMPDSSRPRERFLKYGKEALSDAELFAIILRTGTRGKLDENKKLMSGENVIDMSNRLIKEYSLEKLFDCSLKELQQIKGIGPSKSMQILAMSELGKRYNNSKNPVEKITNAKDVFNYFHEKLKNEKQEHFYVLILNSQN